MKKFLVTPLSILLLASPATAETAAVASERAPTTVSQMAGYQTKAAAAAAIKGVTAPGQPFVGRTCHITDTERNRYLVVCRKTE